MSYRNVRTLLGDNVSEGDRASNPHLGDWGDYPVHKLRLWRCVLTKRLGLLLISVRVIRQTFGGDKKSAGKAIKGQTSGRRSFAGRAVYRLLTPRVLCRPKAAKLVYGFRVLRRPCLWA